jgi:hypothetical protein
VARTISTVSIRAYLARDWDAARAGKRTYWRDRLDRGGLAEALRVTDQLRAWIRSIDPDWPSKEDREEDLETHRRVAETLARAAKAVAAQAPGRPASKGAARATRGRLPRSRARRVR